MEGKAMFSKESSNIFFHLLTQCNLSCRHCYINPDQHGYLPLDVRTIFSWLELFSNRIDTSTSNLIILGGEPTMHPHLSLVIKKAREIGYNSITLDTNGYRVVRLLDSIDHDCLDLFSFSLDAPTPHLNDMLRGKRSYECCLRGITEAKKKGFKTSLIFTVSIANFHSLSKMPRLLSDLKVDHFFIQAIGIRGKWTRNQKMLDLLGQIDNLSWLNIVPRIAEQVANLGIKVTYPKMFLAMEEPFECAGRVADNYFIFPNGRVYQCPLCEDYPLHSKKIRRGKLIDTKGVNEESLFKLDIPEGCVMNKIIQPNNIDYDSLGCVKYKVACCMLKEELMPR